MAYQHLFGSSANSAMGAGYCTLAYTPEFYDMLSDSELSNYNIYHFSSTGDHPIKYYHFYDEYRKVFIQSSISYELDYAGRDSYIANSMVLTEEETNNIIYNNAQPFQRKAFMNGLSEDFVRPEGENIPAVDYPVEYPTNSPEELQKILGAVFETREEMEKFIFALFTLPANHASIFISLPCTDAELSIRAVELMNVIIPALPVELKKKIGFITYTDDISAYKDFNVYFTSRRDLSMQYIPDGYTFDLSSPDRRIAGINEEDEQRFKGMISSFTDALCSGVQPPLDRLLNQITPKLDEYYKYDLTTYAEIWQLSEFAENSSYESLSAEQLPLIFGGYFKYSSMMDDNEFLDSCIDNFWEHEKKANLAHSGYKMTNQFYDVLRDNFSLLSEKEKLRLINSLYFIIGYRFFASDNSLLSYIFDPSTEDNDLRSMLIEHIYGMTYYAVKKQLNRNDLFLDLVNKYLDVQLERYSSDFRSVVAILKSTYDMTESEYCVSVINRYLQSDASDRNAFFAEYFLPKFTVIIDAIAKNAGILELADMAEVIGSVMSSAVSVCRNELAGHIVKLVIIPRASEKINLTELDPLTADTRSIDKLVGFVSRIRSIDKESVSGNLQLDLFLRFCNLVDKGMNAPSKDISLLVELKKFNPEEQKVISAWALNVFGSTKKAVFLFLAFAKYAPPEKKQELTSSDQFDWNAPIDRNHGKVSAVPLNTPSAQNVLVIDYPGLIAKKFQNVNDVNTVAKNLEVILDIALESHICEHEAKAAVLSYITENFLSSGNKKTTKENENVFNGYDKLSQLLSQNSGKHGFSLPFLKKK